jgi:hypothetical protein
MLRRTSCTWTQAGCAFGEAARALRVMRRLKLYDCVLIMAARKILLQDA